MSIYTTETGDRITGSPNLETIIAFGETPLADRLRRADQLDEPALIAPLTLVFCPDSSPARVHQP